MTKGTGIQIEELGSIALAGLILTPGMFWIGNAKSTGSRLGRLAIVAGVIGAALAFEASLDRSVNAVAEKITGGA